MSKINPNMAIYDVKIGRRMGPSSDYADNWMSKRVFAMNAAEAIRQAKLTNREYIAAVHLVARGS